MALIKPTFPALVGPTGEPLAPAGGLPWERRGGAPPAWTPASITGVAEWWRADLGVTDAGAGAVSAWQGQIAGETISQGTAAARPTLTTRDGQSVLSFDGGDLLAGTFSTISPGTPRTLIFVVEKASAATTTNICDGTTVGGRSSIYSQSSTWNLFAGSVYNSSLTVLAAPQAVVGVFNGASSYMYADDLTAASTPGNAGTHVPAGLTVGANYTAGNPIVGFIWEVILVDAAISAGDLALLGAYLDARYAGLSLTY